MGASAIDVVRTVVLVLLATIFVVMGILHFIPKISHGMAAMIPPYLEGAGWASPLNLVYITGACEIVGAAGLLIPFTRTLAGIALIVFLVVVFPANAYAAEDPKRFGRTAIPLIPRAIIQLLLIGAVVFAAL